MYVSWHERVICSNMNEYKIKCETFWCNTAKTQSIFFHSFSLPSNFFFSIAIDPLRLHIEYVYTQTVAFSLLIHSLTMRLSFMACIWLTLTVALCPQCFLPSFHCKALLMYFEVGNFDSGRRDFKHTYFFHIVSSPFENALHFTTQYIHFLFYFYFFAVAWMEFDDVCCKSTKHVSFCIFLKSLLVSSYIHLLRTLNSFEQTKHTKKLLYSHTLRLCMCLHLKSKSTQKISM